MSWTDSPEKMPTLSPWEVHRATEESRINFLQEQYRQGNFVDPNIRFRGKTLLTTSVLNCCEKVLRFLLDMGANPNLKSDQGGRYETPLITAVRQKRLVHVKILIEYGAQISATNFYGQDAMYHAIEDNEFDILEYLLSCTSGFVISQYDHEPCVVCPFRLALTESSIYPLKKKSLLILVQFNYNCPCLSKLVGCIRTSTTNSSSQSSKMILVDPEIIQWLCLGYPVFFKQIVLKATKDNHESNVIPKMIKLKYLSRLVIRSMSSTLAVKKNVNFVQIIQSLPLPSSLLNFLLFKDLQIQIKNSKSK